MASTLSEAVDDALYFALAPAAVPAAAAGASTGAGIAVFIAHAGPVVVAHSPATHLARVQAVLGVAQSVAMLVLAPLLGAVTGADHRLATAAAAVLLLAGATTALLRPIT